MGEITRFPQGLLGLLGIKNYGATPQDMAAVVAGIVDLGPLYLLNDREAVSCGATASVTGMVGWATPVSVPSGQVWYVSDYTVAAGPGAGASCSIAPAAALQDPAFFHPLADYLAIAANQNGSRNCARPFFAGPGVQFGFACLNQVLGPGVVGQLIITRLKV